MLKANLVILIKRFSDQNDFLFLEGRGPIARLFYSITATPLAKLAAKPTPTGQNLQQRFAFVHDLSNTLPLFTKQ